MVYLRTRLFLNPFDGDVLWLGLFLFWEYGFVCTRSNELSSLLLVHIFVEDVRQAGKQHEGKPVAGDASERESPVGPLSRGELYLAAVAI
jgi:hypothetical protein